MEKPMKFHIHIDAQTFWRWSLMGERGKVLATSNPYDTRAEALASVPCAGEVVEVDC